MAPPPWRNPRKGEEPWFAVSLRLANFLPGIAIGFLLGLLLDLSSSRRPKSRIVLAPSTPASRGTKHAAGSSAPAGGSGGEELKMQTNIPNGLLPPAMPPFRDMDPAFSLLLTNPPLATMSMSNATVPTQPQEVI